MKRRTFLSLMGAAALTSSMMLTGCGAGSDDDRKIVRIGHVQSQTHPDHLGLEAFANYINEKLGDKYRVEVYPSELLGSQTEMVQLTQTGAIDFVVASNAIMETFSAKYQIFNLPYLFSSVEAYHEAMDDPEVTDPIFKTTSKAGLETVAWLDAGTRNFYTIKTPHQPALRPEGSEDPRTAVAHQCGNDASAGRHRYPPWASAMCTPRCRPVFWMVPRTTSWL